MAALTEADYQFMLNWEGGFKLINLSTDRGGWTNAGVTLALWSQLAPKLFGRAGNLQTLGQLTYSQWKAVVDYLWKVSGGAAVDSKMIGLMLLEGYWGTGPKFIEWDLQHVLQVPQTGKVDQTTMKAVNEWEPNLLFEKVQQKKWNRLRGFAEKNSDQYVNLWGWHNRLRAFANQFGRAYPEPGPVAYLKSVDRNLLPPGVLRELDKATADPPNLPKAGKGVSQPPAKGNLERTWVTTVLEIGFGGFLVYLGYRMLKNHA